jgi:mannitol/fructose-specific phosphotransferase system IIA component (Ntr-type)
MQFLAEVSRLLTKSDAREKLLSARTHAEIYTFLTGK